MGILSGLPHLAVVFGAGYGEYCTAGLPPSVHHLNLQWAVPAAAFETVHFSLPHTSRLALLSLACQRPLCLPAAALERCAGVRLSARRVYLGLPLRPGAGWADVDDLAARFAQVWRGRRLCCAPAAPRYAPALWLPGSTSRSLHMRHPAAPVAPQFMLGCGLQSVEVTATKTFVFQPVHGAPAPGCTVLCCATASGPRGQGRDACSRSCPVPVLMLPAHA